MTCIVTKCVVTEVRPRPNLLLERNRDPTSADLNKPAHRLSCTLIFFSKFPQRRAGGLGLEKAKRGAQAHKIGTATIS